MFIGNVLLVSISTSLTTISVLVRLVLKILQKKQIWDSKPPFGVMLGVKNGTVGFPRYGFILVRLKCTASTVTNDQPTNQLTV